MLHHYGMCRDTVPAMLVAETHTQHKVVVQSDGELLCHRAWMCPICVSNPVLFLCYTTSIVAGGVCLEPCLCPTAPTGSRSSQRIYLVWWDRTGALRYMVIVEVL